MLQVITSLVIVSLSLGPLSLEDFNPLFEIFNLPVVFRFLSLEGLNPSFDLPHRLLDLLKSLLCKAELLDQLSIIPF